MHKAQRSILAAFSENGGKALATSDIVEILYPGESKRIAEILEVASPSEVKKQLSERAKLHRRANYHINVLVAANILACQQVKAHGEKLFVPAVQEGQQLITLYEGERIILNRPALAWMPLEHFEHTGVLHRVMGSEWTNRVNAIVIFAQAAKNVETLYAAINLAKSLANDVIGIVGLEKLLARASEERMRTVLREIAALVEHTGLRISLHIAVQQVSSKKMLSYLSEEIYGTYKNRITVVWATDSRDVITKSSSYELLAQQAMAHDAKLTVQNTSLLKEILFIGRAGPYSIKAVDKLDSVLVCAASHNSVVIDIDAFFTQFDQARNFKQCILDIAKSLFIANVQLRDSLHDYMNVLATDRTNISVDLFNQAKNIIRLWNFDPGVDERAMRIHLFEEIVKEMRAYVETQKIIFLSCGMPASFDVSLSVAYRRFDHKKIMHRKYHDVEYKQTEDLLDQKQKNLFLFLEQVNKLLDNILEVRCVRKSASSPEQLIRELGVVMTTYHLPLICFIAPSGKQGSTLHDYVGGDT